MKLYQACKKGGVVWNVQSPSFLVAFVNYLAIRMVFVIKAKPYSYGQCLMKNKMKERDRVFADSVINFSDIFDSMFNLLQWYMRKLGYEHTCTYTKLPLKSKIAFW